MKVIAPVLDPGFVLDQEDLADFQRNLAEIEEIDRMNSDQSSYDSNSDVV